MFNNEKYFYKKYLKYKQKYIKLGGGGESISLIRKIKNKVVSIFNNNYIDTTDINKFFIFIYKNKDKFYYKPLEDNKKTYIGTLYSLEYVCKNDLHSEKVNVAFLHRDQTTLTYSCDKTMTEFRTFYISTTPPEQVIDTSFIPDVFDKEMQNLNKSITQEDTATTTIFDIDVTHDSAQSDGHGGGKDKWTIKYNNKVIDWYGPMLTYRIFLDIFKYKLSSEI